MEPNLIFCHLCLLPLFPEDFLYVLLETILAECEVALVKFTIKPLYLGQTGHVILPLI